VSRFRGVESLPEHNHWLWFFVAIGLVGLGVAIAMMAKMPA
jgi:hypothetical protein